MPKISKSQNRVHTAFLGMKRPFDPTNVYITLAKLIGMKEEAIERGLGKLFREGKLKSPEDRPRRPNVARGGRGPADDDGFR